MGDFLFYFTLCFKKKTYTGAVKLRSKKLVLYNHNAFVSALMKFLLIMVIDFSTRGTIWFRLWLRPKCAWLHIYLIGGVLYSIINIELIPFKGIVSRETCIN
jgi:hypothetical protein